MTSMKEETTMLSCWRAALMAAFVLAAVSPSPAQEAKPVLPADIVARKTLTIALFAAFPPMAYRNPETNELVGIDVDLANYVGRKLGIAIAWQDTSYESAVNELTTGRVDMAFSLLDTPASADRLDYVDYLTSGMQAYTLVAHAPIATVLDMCGLKLGANRRNGFDAAMRQWSTDHCLPAGRPPITVQETDGTPAARLALRQGRVDGVVQSSESVPYTMSREPGVYARIGQPLTELRIAMAFPKQSTQLRAAVTQALKDAVADGSYQAALVKHGLQDNNADAVIRAE
jgi:polar amino acid transport system substrate-binding protein